MTRVGLGFDAHAFATGNPARPLVLGGVTVEGAPGLAGWSDGDVVAHALADAILGAAGLGDLGAHFPKDAVPEGVSSLRLLADVVSMAASAGYRIGNIDATVISQEVRIGPHRARMQETLAATVGLDPSVVSVKATTTDRMGFTGRGEGIAAVAVALLERDGSASG